MHHIIVLIACFVISTAVFANPVLDHVGAGNVTIQQAPNSTVINQSSQKAIINWQSFNIGKDELTHFQQPAGGIALNRINPSQGVSQIYGRLTATGRIILVNPAGIFFGPGSYVNVGGLIASTANISDQDFLNDYYHFVTAPDYNGSIVNQGQIIAADHGLVALIGGAVTNDGYIQANMGHVILASGTNYTMTFAGNDLVSFSIDKGTSESGVTQIKNTGSIIANGGHILVTAKAASGILDNVIDMKGIAQAQSVIDAGTKHDGEIILWGDGIVTIGANLNASSFGFIDGGRIIAKSYALNVENGATFNVSSSNGNGGFVETSGTHALQIGQVNIDTSAPQGKTGTWLIDPADITITTVDSNISGSTPFTATATGATLDVATLVSALASTNVTVQTTNDGFSGNGDIIVNSGITWTSANTLLLQAFNNIIINAPISGVNGSLHLSAVNAPSSITTGVNGTVDVNNFNLLQGQWYQVGALPAFNVRNNFQINTGVLPNATTQFIRATSGDGTSAGTAYVLTDIYGLQGIASNATTLGQHFKLGANIDASTVTNWNGGNGFKSIGNNTTNFSGTFNGQNYSISNLYITNPDSDSSAALFSNATNTISNLVLYNPTIHITSTNGYSAAVVAGSAGNLSNISIYGGSIRVDANISGAVGGIAGFASGTLDNLSVNNMSINVNATAGYGVGGVLGYTFFANASNLYNYNTNVTTINGGAGISSMLFFSTLNGAVNTGAVRGYSVSGIAASAPGSIINNTYNVGTLTATGTTPTVGGIVGDAVSSTSVSFNYNSGQILTPNATGGNIGGIAGTFDGTGSLANNYWDIGSSGVTKGFGSNTAGGLTNVTDLYGGCFGNTTCGSATAGYATNTTTYDLTKSATFSGWDITNAPSNTSSTPANTWFIFEDSTRPMLMSENTSSITNAHQLQMMGAALDGSYTLVNDIDLGSALDNKSEVWGTKSTLSSGAGFVPIGDDSNYFTGSFDGSNHTISNLYIDATNKNTGLFGNTSSGTLANLTLSNVDIRLQVNDGVLRYVGSLAGYASSNINNITIINGSIDGESTSGYAMAGGIAGGNFLSISNVSNYAQVSGNKDVGGIAGRNWGTISDATNLGTITGRDGWSIGGIAGWNPGIITRAYNGGSVSNLNGGNAGGVVGNNGNLTATISNSYSTGTVQGSSSSSIGGFVGYTGAESQISNSYSSGQVIGGGTTAGGFVGVNSAGATYSNDFWDTASSTKSNVVGLDNGSTSGITGGTFDGSSGANLSALTTFSGAAWDITSTASVTASAPSNIWFIFEGRTRPLLMMENSSNISNAHQLQMMGAALGGDYTIVNDINLINTSTNASDVWNTASGFVPIATGSSFTGSLDGQNHVINNLYINNSVDNAGLFANINSSLTFKDLVLNNVNITHQNPTGYVGAFAGQADGTFIMQNLASSGTISGYKTGGLVGFIGPNVSGGLITESYSTATLSGLNDTGGIAGANFGSTISKSYFGGTINNGGHFTSAGGILGYGAAGAVVTDSYNTGNVTSGSYAGGIVGYTTGSSSYNNVYSTGTISGLGGLAGGLVGSLNFSTISNSFWNADTSGQLTPVGSNNGTVTAVFAGCFTGSCTSSVNSSYLFGGTTYANLSALATFTTTLASNGGTAWDMTATPSTTDIAPANTWFIFEGYTMPILTSEHSSIIRNVHQLQMMGAVLDGSYTQANDLDFNTVTANDVWGAAFSAYDVANPYAFPSAKGFNPIGNITTNFTGSFDGQDYTITHLVLYTPATNYVGLFGVTGSTASLNNIVIYNPVIHGGGYVGAIAGKNGGTITNSHATSNTSGQAYLGGELQVNNVDVRSTWPTGSGSVVGGIAGQNDGTITDSYTRFYIMGGQSGGLVGVNNGTIGRSYSTGSNYDGGYNYAGGLVAINSATGVIYDSFSSGTSGGGYYSAYYGGFVAYNAGTISKSYNTGIVYPGFANGAIGGFVGYNTGTITDSYNTGYIAYGQGQFGLFGGFVGTNTGVISNSYATTTNYYPGVSYGFAGDNSGTINHSYWDIGTSGNTAGYASNTGTINGLYGGCFGNTTCNASAITNATNAGSAPLDLTLAATYTTGGSNWDMTNIWNIIENQSYPFLRDFYSETPRAISGYHPSLSSFQSVSLAYDNQIKDSAYTYFNGFSYFLEGLNNISNIDNSLADGAGLLVISNSGVLANYATYAPSGGASISGVNGFVLTANTVTGGNSETNLGLVTPLTNSQIVATRGSLINSNILFTGSGNDITISNGYSFATTAATPYSLDGNISVTNGSLTFNGTLSLNMPSASLTTNSSGDIFIYNTVNGNANAFTINTVGNASVVTGIMSDLSSFTKSGTGILTLSGTNTYTGSNSITAGTLRITNDAALGSGAVTVNSGGTLQLVNAMTLNNTLSLNGSGASGSAGALDIIGSGTTITNGVITLAGDTTIGVASGSIYNQANTIDGSTDGGQSLTLSGAGSVLFNSEIGNGLNTSLSALTSNLNSTLGAANIKTTGTQNYNGTVTLSTNNTVTSTAGDINFGAISGPYNLTVDAGGAVTLGSVNTGSLTVSALSGITLNGDVTTTGNQIYNNTLSSPNTMTFTTTAGGTMSFQTLNIVGQLFMVAGGASNATITLNNAVTSDRNEFTSTGGTFINTTADIWGRTGNVFNGPLTLLQNASFVTRHGGDGILINGTLAGPGGLTETVGFNSGFNDHALFGDDVGYNADHTANPLAYLTVFENSSNFGGGEAYIRFMKNVNVTGAISLVSNANFGYGNIQFDGPAGSTITADSISATGGGGVRFNGYTINTNGDQYYSINGQGGIIGVGNFAINGGDVTLTSAAGSVTLDGGSAGTGTIEGDGISPRNLTLSGATGVTIAVAAGNINPLNSLSVTNGVTTLQTAATAITTLGSQAYNNGLIVNVNSTLKSVNAGSITFGTSGIPGTVNGANSLAINTGVTTPGAVTFWGAVGNTTALSSLNVKGATTINGGSITTTGIQNYDSVITLGADTSLTTTANGDVTFNNSINGNQALGIDAGSGNVTFTNSINSGDLTSLSSLGSGSVNVGGSTMFTSGLQSYGGAIALLFAGNTTFTSSGSSVSASGITGNGNGLTINTATAGTISGVMSNLNNFTKQGSGNLSLTGANNYTGTTVISAGTLSIGNGGASGTLGSGNVTNNSSLIFNRNNNLTITGVIAGTGSVTQAGTGTTILANNNTYTGLTTISNGTLQIGNGGPGAVVGDIINNSTLIFNTSNNFSNTHIISGTGSITQQGTGTITLGGNNIFDGVFNINSGSVIVTHANALGTTTGSTILGNGASLIISGVTVSGEGLTLNGGVFGGSGTAGFGGDITLNSNATISNNGGTFTLNGAINGANTLTLNGAGTTILGSAVGSGTALTNLIATSNLVINGGSVTTSGNQSYQNVTTNNDTVFTSNGTGVHSITFNGAITGGHNITLDGSNTGNYTFSIGNIAANNVTITSTNGSNNVLNLNTGGAQNFTVTSNNTGNVSGINSVTGNFIFNNIENINGGSGADSFRLAGGTLTGNINGGGGNNTLIGDNLANTWTINATNGGQVTGITGNFTNINNLTGGTNLDIFNFIQGNSISGVIDGGDVINQNEINFTGYTNSLKLYLNMPVSGVIDAGNIYDSNNKIVSFTRIQKSNGNNISYIILPNEPSLVITYYDTSKLNGEIADPFYYFGWIVEQQPVINNVPNNPGNTPNIAQIVNQPSVNNNNNNNYNQPGSVNYLYYLDPDYGLINDVSIEPLLNTTTVKAGNLCYAPQH